MPVIAGSTFLLLLKSYRNIFSLHFCTISLLDMNFSLLVGVGNFQPKALEKLVIERQKRIGTGEIV